MVNVLLASNLQPGGGYFLQISQDGHVGNNNSLSVLSERDNCTAYSSIYVSSTSVSSGALTETTALSSSPSTSPTEPSTDSNTASTASTASSNFKDVSVGTIAGIIIACLAALAAAVVLGICWRRRQKNRKERPQISDGGANGTLEAQYIRASRIKAPVEEHGYPDTPTPYQVSPLTSEEDLPSTLPGGAHSPLKATPRVSMEHDVRYDTRPAGYEGNSSMAGQ